MSDKRLVDRRIGSKNRQDGLKEGLDTLTALCTFSAAKEQISERMRMAPQGLFHVIILHIGNISQLTDEYGFAFAMAVLENQAVLWRRSFQLKDKAVLCRLGKDVLMAFVQEEDAGEVENYARLAQQKLQDRYFGRREKLRCRVTVGVYHVPPQERDLNRIMTCAGKAVGYGLRCRIPFVVYGESMADEKVTADESLTAEKTAEESRLQYDGNFIAFAVSLLSNTTDLDSSLDMLAKQIGWHYDYDEVLISSLSRTTAPWCPTDGGAEKALFPIRRRSVPLTIGTISFPALTRMALI